LSYFVIAEALEGSLFVSHIASVVFEKRETASQLSGEGLFAKVRIRHDASSYKVRMPCLACIHRDHAEPPSAEALGRRLVAHLLQERCARRKTRDPEGLRKSKGACR
jgi:hypothetical protein